MKTIFITSFHPLISRNILRTGILEGLKEDVHVYILCPKRKEEYFIREFAKKNEVDVIGVEERPLTKKEHILRTLGALLLPTSTIFFKRKEKFQRDRKVTDYFFSFFFLYIFARVRHASQLYRRLCAALYDRDIFAALFKQHHPDLIFSTDVLEWNDVRLLVEAKRHDIKTIGMVRSWDNLTNKSLLPVESDHFFVNNAIIRNELVAFNKIRFKDISIVGMPQFDYYVGYTPTGRKNFFEKLGFYPERRIILFAPMGEKFIASDWNILQILHDAIEEGQIQGSPQILVRYPPGDGMAREKLRLSERVKIYFDRPGRSFSSRRKKDNEFDNDDMIHLADSLFYSSVLVNAGSSLCIDMAAFDRPIVFPAFDGVETPYFRSAKKLFLYHHYQYLLRTKACRVVKNKEELIEWINAYLVRSDIDREKRKRLIKEQVGLFDGKAHERIDRHIRQLLA